MAVLYHLSYSRAIVPGETARDFTPLPQAQGLASIDKQRQRWYNISILLLEV
jgi:hypothetical protein